MINEHSKQGIIVMRKNMGTGMQSVNEQNSPPKITVITSVKQNEVKSGVTLTQDPGVSRKGCDWFRAFSN
jgi:glucose dehydrogenase